MADEPARDPMEPPGVATGRVGLTFVAIYALLAASFLLLAGFYVARVHGSERPVANRFPAPALETNTQPRDTGGRGHGPAPLRDRPAIARAGERAPADPALAAAMATVVARGAAAYDPAPAP